MSSSVFSNKIKYTWNVMLWAMVFQDVELAVRESTAKWKIVVGHHAIRSVGHHGDTQELIKQLLPILQVRKLSV